MQIHELTNTADLSSTDYVGVDNGTTTRRFDLGALIASIRSRLTNAETGITNLQTSVSDVQDDVADAQSDITGLGTRLDATGSSITSHGNRLTTAESNITTLQNDKVDKTTPLLNFDDTATDPLTDDGALANALTALGILSDVIPSGGGSLYLKKALTEILEYIKTQYVVEIKSTTGQSVAGGGRATLVIDVTKTGYTAVGIVGVMIYGTEVFSIGRMSLNYNKTQANVTIINTFTDARTPDGIDVHVLYRKS